MEKIKSYFERYPQSLEVFENDGVLFHDRGAAESYGKGEYTRFTRKQVEEAPVADTEDAEELAAKELAEKEAADKAAELAEKEAADKAAELAAKEQADKEAAELAAKELAEKKAAEDAAELDAAKLTLGGKEVKTIPLKGVKQSNPPKTAE